MSAESNQLKSSMKKPDRVLPEGIQSTRSIGRFDDPSSNSVTEATCNFENFWRALFCFEGPPLPDAELPRNFKEFRSDSSKRINSFTLASSRSDEIEVSEFHGVSNSGTPKKVEDPEEAARKQKDVEELKSLLNYNTEERLKEQSIDEDLLEAQRLAAEAQEMQAARKLQMQEMKRIGASTDGTRPRGNSASLPPQSPRHVTPAAASSPSGQSPMQRQTSTNGHIAAGIASPRNVDLSGLTVNVADHSSLRSTLSKSNSGTGSIPRSARAVPHSPYHTSVPAAQFSQLNPANTGDSVDVADISNFTRFACTDGVSCFFYLPTREGVAKSKPARFHCDPESTKFRLDILAASSSPASPMHSGAEVVVKSLNFDTANDILAVTKGRGPVVRMPEDIAEELILHITLHNKPEINLSFNDATSRNVVYNALPNLLATSAANAKKVKDGNTPTHHHHGDLMGLSLSVVKLTSIYWVEVPVKSVYSSGKFTLKLLLTLSDDTLVIYNVPKEYESVNNNGTTPTSVTAAAASKQAEVDAKRRALNDQLNVFTQSRWNPDSLPSGFDIMLEIAFSEIKKVSHVGETETDHVIEIFYHKEKKEETEVRIRLDAAIRRKALIVFLEDKRKSCKKQSHHHELL